MDSFINNVILTTVVFAAFVTSATNVILSLINNHRLKRLQNEKRMNEIDQYRYSKLYELIVNWHDYDSEVKGKSASEIAFYRLLNLFMDDSGRYAIAKPLLDYTYIEPLEIKKEECEVLLNKLIECERPDGKHSLEFSIFKQKYFDAGCTFSKLLKDAINCQLELLLRKNTKYD